MRIMGLIPVRAGSQRIKNKNIRPFAGSSLLEIKINQLKQVPGLEGIVVNSDSDEMLDLARSQGCQTVKRDAFFAQTNTSGNDFFENIATNFDGEIIVMTAVTNPLLKPATIAKTIEQYFELVNQGYDSVNTSHEFKDYILLDGKPWNFKLDPWTNSQYLPNTALYNNAINVISRETAIKRRNMIGFCPFFRLIDEYEAVDINNPLDFEIAEELYKRLFIQAKD